MSSPSRPVPGDATLPDPTGNYQLVVFPQRPGRASDPPNWLGWQQYFAQISLTLSGTNCQVACAGQNVTSPYTQGNNPNVGALQFSLTLNSANCAFNLSVYDPPGPGLRIQGTVGITQQGSTQTFEVRLLQIPIAVPTGSYTVTSDTNDSTLAGSLTISSATAGTYQQTGQSSQPITLSWNGNGAANRPTLSFGASVVPSGGGTAKQYTFSALFDPNWNGTKLAQKFHGTAVAIGPSGGGGGTDWSAEDSD